MTPTEKPWKGDLMCYGCPDCGFDALEPDEVREHWDRNHGPIARISPVLGPNGEPIMVEDERTVDWRTSRMIEIQRQEAERLAAAEEREARREAAAAAAAKEAQLEQVEDTEAAPAAPEPELGVKPQKKAARKKRSRKN